MLPPPGVGTGSGLGVSGAGVSAAGVSGASFASGGALGCSVAGGVVAAPPCPPPVAFARPLKLTASVAAIISSTRAASVAFTTVPPELLRFLFPFAICPQSSGISSAEPPAT